MSAHPAQMEIATVVDHSRATLIKTIYASGSSCCEPKPDSGIRLAKLLTKYDDRPSSELWREIQALAWEILK
jgi:hypothetical protein